MTATYGELRTDKERQVDAELKGRVERGIALLQKEHGNAWVEKINMKTLDLEDVKICVLGQVYGLYDVGIEALFDGDEEDSVRHGFDIGDSDEDWIGYSELQATWESYLSGILDTDTP